MFANSDPGTLGQERRRGFPTAEAKALRHRQGKETGDKYLPAGEGPLSWKAFQVPGSFLPPPPGGSLGAPRVAPQGLCTRAELHGPTPVFSGPERSVRVSRNFSLTLQAWDSGPTIPVLFLPSHQSTLRGPSSLHSGCLSGHPGLISGLASLIPSHREASLFRTLLPVLFLQILASSRLWEV